MKKKFSHSSSHPTQPVGVRGKRAEHNIMWHVSKSVSYATLYFANSVAKAVNFITIVDNYMNLICMYSSHVLLTYYTCETPTHPFFKNTEVL